MDRHEEHDDDPSFCDANSASTASVLFGAPARNAAAATSSGARAVPPPRGSGGIEALDLNPQSTDLPDEISSSSSTGAVGESQAAAGGRRLGRQRSPVAVRSRGAAAADLPPVGKAARPYRAPRLAGAVIKSPGATPVRGRRGIRGGVRGGAADAVVGSAHGSLGHGIDSDDSSLNSSSSDDEDEILEVARSQLDLIKKYGAITCMFGMIYESTSMNKTKKRKSDHSGC